jgi:hypothetical protein
VVFSPGIIIDCSLGNAINSDTFAIATAQQPKISECKEGYIKGRSTQREGSIQREGKHTEEAYKGKEVYRGKGSRIVIIVIKQGSIN